MGMESCMEIGQCMEKNAAVIVVGIVVKMPVQPDYEDAHDILVCIQRHKVFSWEAWAGPEAARFFIVRPA